jgi:putative ABC transport system permease protein
VVVINEAMARRFWPKGDALGVRISLSSANDLEPKPRQIVGIVGDVHERTEQPGDPPPLNIYVPVSQVVDGLTAYMVRLPYNWAVRTRAEPHVEALAIKPSSNGPPASPWWISGRWTRSSPVPRHARISASP